MTLLEQVCQWVKSLFSTSIGFNEPVTENRDRPELVTLRQQELLLEALRRVGATRACQRCGHDQHTIQPGFGLLFLQSATPNLVLGSGPTIPVVYVACDKCGNINTHALGALGLIDHPEFNFGGR